METYVFEGKMTALSSISHSGGQSLGITSKLRREKFVQPDGSVEEVPTISGNGLRGMLRDRGMLHMCRELGIGSDEKGALRGLPMTAFYFLFCGGSLTSVPGKAISIEEARQIRSLIPLVGVFGGAMGNQILPGKLKVGKAIPICTETRHLLPESFRNGATPSVWDFCQEEMFTRKDDGKNEHYQALIEAPRGNAIGTSERKSSDRVKTGECTQMMYYVETFAAGTPFYWRLTLDDPTNLEFEAFATTLVEFSKQPYIGGKSNIGMGEVSVQFDRWLKINSRARADATAVAPPLGRAYAEHLSLKRADVLACLEAMG